VKDQLQYDPWLPINATLATLTEHVAARNTHQARAAAESIAEGLYQLERVERAGLGLIEEENCGAAQVVFIGVQPS
jgi:hypothetical protein